MLGDGLADALGDIELKGIRTLNNPSLRPCVYPFLHAMLAMQIDHSPIIIPIATPVQMSLIVSPRTNLLYGLLYKQTTD